MRPNRQNRQSHFLDELITFEGLIIVQFFLKIVRGTLSGGLIA